MKTKDKKKKNVLFIIIPILLLIMTISFSYAYWRKTNTQEKVNLFETLTCLSTTITDVNNAINLEDEYPIPNVEGMGRTPYTFKVTNDCNVLIDLVISLEVLPVTTLNSTYVRVGFDNSYKKLSDYTTNVATINGATSYKLSETRLDPLSNESFNLRLWVDEATTNAQGINKTFNSKIVVSASPVS